jgi:hypothetical protein
MERLPGKLDRPKLVRPIHVPPFSDERMAAKPRLQPDLIALPGLEPDLNQSRGRERLQRLVAADRILPFAIARVRRFLNQ